MNVDLQNIVSSQPEVSPIEEAIHSYMNKHYSDDKLPQVTHFFNKLLDDNQQTFSTLTTETKVARLFSTIIPLIQLKIACNKQFQMSCKPLENVFKGVDVNIQTSLDQIISDCLWTNYKAYFECAIQSTLGIKKQKACIIKTSSPLSSLEVSPEAKQTFNAIYSTI